MRTRESAARGSCASDTMRGKSASVAWSGGAGLIVRFGDTFNARMMNVLQEIVTKSARRICNSRKDLHCDEAAGKGGWKATMVFGLLVEKAIAAGRQDLH